MDTIYYLRVTPFIFVLLSVTFASSLRISAPPPQALLLSLARTSMASRPKAKKVLCSMSPHISSITIES
ncbi:hypothetical protein B0H14DRAFT_3513671 [Mycena olivaceomarginata]|nr:hypothetical protein B0H14DRAFT_3513671 [Mycena olivaceomarginata]